MNVSPAGIQFIAAHEGLSLTAYADSGGLLTIGMAKGKLALLQMA